MKAELRSHGAQDPKKAMQKSGFKDKTRPYWPTVAAGPFLLAFSLLSLFAFVWTDLWGPGIVPAILALAGLVSAWAIPVIFIKVSKKLHQELSPRHLLYLPERVAVILFGAVFSVLPLHAFFVALGWL